MHRVRLIALAAFAGSAQFVFPQVPASQLMTPPPGAQKFLVISVAGQHGSSSLWRTADGSFASRESILLRGMVWEQDETIHFGRNGQPDRVVIRGITPNGDAAEAYTVADGEARWKTPIDQGAKAYDNQSHYLPQGGTFVSASVLAEKLYLAPGRKLSLLPAGEARLVKLTDLMLGEGASRTTVSAFALEGLSLGAVPIWLDSRGKFFGFIMGLGILPEAYAGDFLKLQKAQNDALALRAPALARRFGAVAATPVAFVHVKRFDTDSASFLDDQTVIAERGKVTAVGPAGSLPVPPNAKVIDRSGKTLVPGLWDAHMHVSDDTDGPMLLSIGVTSLRNPGAEIEPAVSRAERILKGELLFPSVYSSVLIDGKGPLAAQAGISVSSAAKAVAAVRMAKDRGFIAVKFYGSMKPEWLTPAIAEAKRSGLHVHGHVPATMRPS